MRVRVSITPAKVGECVGKDGHAMSVLAFESEIVVFVLNILPWRELRIWLEVRTQVWKSGQQQLATTRTRAWRQTYHELLDTPKNERI